MDMRRNRNTDQTPQHTGKASPSSNRAKPIKIFYCYAHEDKELRDQLEKHLASLRRIKQITEWYDGEILPGREWKSEIDSFLNNADIILLLVSSDFVSSDYCYSIEMQRALARYKDGECHVIPIMLRPVNIEETFISELQQLPTGGKPITRWDDPDDAFKDVATGIHKVIKDIETKKDQIQDADRERAGRAERKAQIEYGRRRVQRESQVPPRPLRPPQETKLPTSDITNSTSKNKEPSYEDRPTAISQRHPIPAAARGTVTVSRPGTKYLVVMIATILLLTLAVLGTPSSTPQVNKGSSTSPTPGVRTVQATSSPPYVSELNSTNSSLFLNSFSQALQYQDVQNIEEHTDIINFTETCDPSVIITSGKCDHDWKEIKSLLSMDELEFDFPQYAQQNPPLTGACSHASGGDLYVAGSVDNKGFVLPISHFPSAVLTFGRPANGSESPLEWESVYIC